VISFRAYHRKVVRKARCDQLRRDIREQLDLLNRYEAGDPEAIRQVEENRALAASYPAPEEADYPEPGDYFPDEGYFGATRGPIEPDPEPWHLQRPGESDRQYHRRTGRPDLAARRAAQLLARGYWDANRPLPGAIREALCVLSLTPRELRRVLVAVWGRRDWTLREPVPCWAPPLVELAPGLRKVERWLEVCLHTGPPPGVAALEAPVISP
jgi:hypothetical protein